MKTITPMMRQYFEIKNQHPDKYIFFRLGDFYELFDQDAIEVSKMLQITLTERNKTIMCGIPHHQLHRYAYKVISKGKKIAIVEQMDTKDSFGLMDRRVTQVITPGTTLDELNLSGKEKNFIINFSFSEMTNNLLAPIQNSASFLVALDITTGEVLFISMQTKEDMAREIDRFFENYSPKEIILSRRYSHSNEVAKINKEYPQVIINFVEEPTTKSVEECLKKKFSKNDFSVTNNSWIDSKDFYYPLAEGLSLILNYAEGNQNEKINYLQKPKWITKRNHMTLDCQALQHLEIFKNNFNHSSKYSLLSVIDYTLTPMGARKLQESLALPSLDVGIINYRLEQTDYLFLHPYLLKNIRNQLKNIYDLERISTKIVLKKVLPREMISLKKSLLTIHQLFSMVLEKKQQLLFKDDEKFDEEKMATLLYLGEKINKILLDIPNNEIQKGGVVNPQSNTNLHEYFLIKKNSEQLLAQLEVKEKKASGINALKIKYNDNLGYFFETRKNNLNSIPEYFIRKQSLLNCERFVTEELIVLEGKISEANEKSITLETEIFLKLREELATQISFFQLISSYVANLDLITSFAELAIIKNYVKPNVILDGVLSIKGGRHPVIENYIEQPFSPNDLEIGEEENIIEIITGPNMSGKSTFLRQNALIVILAQIGSFVPAQEAVIPICDSIFTRIGSGDRLVQGESTFLVEMKETANILKQVTAKSLVIMDEIGRGTSTYDGLALAWSILEYLNQHTQKRAKTLFATHYQELIVLATHKGISHYHVAVKEEGDEIIFLKKVVKGMTSKSYGVHVAKLAGIPKEVITRALEILQDLEKKSQILSNQTITAPKIPQANPIKKNQLSESEKKLLDFDINNKTPLETVQFLMTLKERLKEVEKNIL